MSKENPHKFTKNKVVIRSGDIITERMEKFCWEYSRTLNLKQSFVKAGYSDEIGCMPIRLFRKPMVQKRLAEIRKELDKKEIVTVAYVVEKLKREAEDLSETGSAGSRVKALELLGKHAGMFTEKLEIKHRGKIEHTHNHVKVEELDLPLEMKLQLLDAIRKKREASEKLLEDKSEKPIEENIQDAEVIPSPPSNPE